MVRGLPRGCCHPHVAFLSRRGCCCCCCCGLAPWESLACVALGLRLL